MSDIVRAIRLRALKNVALEEDYDYALRKIFRAYSEKFYTPLHVVADLPLIDVLTAFFEDRYEQMDEVGLDNERARLIETDEERKARKADENAAEDDADAFVAEIARKEQERLAKLNQERPQPPPLADVPERQRMVMGLDERGQPTFIKTLEPEPVIKMDFASDEEFNDLINGMGVMEQPD